MKPLLLPKFDEIAAKGCQNFKTISNDLRRDENSKENKIRWEIFRRQNRFKSFYGWEISADQSINPIQLKGYIFYLLTLKHNDDYDKKKQIWTMSGRWSLIYIIDGKVQCSGRQNRRVADKYDRWWKRDDDKVDGVTLPQILQKLARHLW